MSSPPRWPPSVLSEVAAAPDVVEAVASVRSDIDRVRRHRTVRRDPGAVRREAAFRGAWASAVLDREVAGVLDRAELREGRGDPAALGALRAAAEVGRLAGTWLRAPLQVLARLHVLAAAGLVPSDQLGRPVTVPRVEGGAAGVTGRLAALAELVTAGSGLPPVVTAAVVHGELLTLRPFSTAHGVIARAAARVALVAGGTDPDAIAIPDVGHLERRDEYAAALTGYRDGDSAGVRTWVLHCATALSLGCRETSAVCEAMARGSSANGAPRVGGAVADPRAG